MTTRTLRIRGDAEPDEVWHRYTVPARWPEWSPQIRRVETAACRITAGQTGTVVGVGGLRVRFIVLAVDDDARTWDWRAVAGPVTLTFHHAVAAAPGGGTVSTLRVTGPFPIVAGYLPIARFALTRLVRA